MALPLSGNPKIFNFDIKSIRHQQTNLNNAKIGAATGKKRFGSQQQVNIIKLKGSLISKGYTEIIHILDQDEEFHINTFETLPEQLNEVQKYINAFINAENLTETISIK
ncbi:hypothetical protein [Flavobacterium sp. HJSW_4]|uniref:hypothetical protein n=1 Tax=Flavobacterium sp. HJSW_4 TaxID=3344660 RepID=UPI0035F3867F